jgi:hypothetical protein
MNWDTGSSSSRHFNNAHVRSCPILSTLARRVYGGIVVFGFGRCADPPVPLLGGHTADGLE